MKTFFSLFLTLWTALVAASIVPAAAQGKDGMKLSTVVIDAGHGGHDSGCISQDRKTYEKTIALDIAQRLSKKIRAAYPDVKVILTRNEDKYVTLSGRADIANNAGADLFISVHVNAQAKGTSANGYSIHCLGQSAREGNDLFSKNLELIKRENSVILLEDDYKTKYQGFDPSDPQSYIFFSLMQNAHLEQSLAFASDVADAMKGGPIRRSRGVSQDPFWVLWRTTMPSVLIEVGFISNAEDLKVMRTSEGRDGIAGNIFRAFSVYKKRYDGSMAIPDRESSAPAADTVSTAQEEAPRQEGGEKEETVAPDDAQVLYGIQVLATSRKMSAKDPFFRGYAPTEIKAGRLFKYVLVPSESLADVKKKLPEISRKFPGCFIVKKEGESVSVVR